MKKFVMMSIAVSAMTVSGLAQAAEVNTQPAPITAPTHTSAPVAKKTGLLKGARIVPDTAAAPASATGNTFKKADQGYSKMSTYNVVNEENKPITNDWTRPKSWRIGYKNKNRTPINE